MDAADYEFMAFSPDKLQGPTCKIIHVTPDETCFGDQGSSSNFRSAIGEFL